MIGDHVYVDRGAMNTHGYVANYYIDDLDNFHVEEQYRLLYDLPDGRFIAPQVKRRMFYKGETASQALEHVRRFIPAPISPNSLSPSLYDAPSLIDEERWHEARVKLRREGVLYKTRKRNVEKLMKVLGAILPCDYMFSDERRMVESFGSNETIRPAGDVARRWDPAESIAEDSPLLIADQSRITDQSDGVILWQLLIDFGRAVRKILAKLLTSQCAC